MNPYNAFNSCRPPRCRLTRGLSMAVIPPKGASGFSLIELLIASVLLAVFFAAAASTLQNPLQSGRRAAAIDAVEAEISRDLGWIKAYSKAWRCLNGRFPGCTNASSNIYYNPTSTSGGECSNIASPFLADARTANTVPARPYAIPDPATTSQALSLPAVGAGVALGRTITSESGNTRLRILYTATGNVALRKEASVYIEAAAWCPG